MAEPTPTWQGGSFRRASRVLFLVGLGGLFVCAMARSSVLLPFLVGLPLLAGTVLFVLSTNARREQSRHWEDYQAGKLTAPPFPALTVIGIVLGMLVPPAVLLSLRIPTGCSVVNLFGLPWPPQIQTPVFIICLTTAAVGIVLVVLGRTWARTRSISSAVLLMWAIVSPFAFLILFISVYGDPAPGGCM
jgi:hypothetical protein